jgi:hypothetical protein
MGNNRNTNERICSKPFHDVVPYNFNQLKIYGKIISVRYLLSTLKRFSGIHRMPIAPAAISGNP